jgi:hypothetical protein
VIDTSTSQTGNLWQINIFESRCTLSPQSLPTNRAFLNDAISRPPSTLNLVAEKPVQTQELNFWSK